MPSFFDNLAIMRTDRAQYFAEALFRESFNVPFPVPRDNCGLPIPTPPSAWRQYIALYREANGSFRTVGFANWIRYQDIYVGGGLCVDRHFYRSLPREHWQACRAAGGIAQLIMEAGERELNDAPAWFGYCDDKKAYLVDLRVGFVPTSHQYLVAKWFGDPSPAERERLTALAASIGPF